MNCRITKILAALATASMLLAACGGAAQPTAAPTTAANAPAPTTAAATAAPTKAAATTAPTTAAATAAPTKAAAEPTKATAATAAPAASTGKSIKAIVGLNGSAAKYLPMYAQEFTAKTGIKVDLVQQPSSATETLAQYLQFLSAKSSDIDVYQFDVIWPGILADHMVDLTQYFSKEELAGYFPAIVQNNTVNGHLTGIPWFTDAGLLYYRTDLLQKYGFSNPPATWAELESQAKKIQDGERAAGNASFWGFVFQGKAYEGLTCDALEWQVSNGGGQIVEPDGKVTIDNAQAAAAFDMAAKWVGTIAPKDVTTYQEEESRGVWSAGNSAFMRNWPYAYSLSAAADSKIKDKFDVTLLPKGDGANARNADTLGGWQLGVSKYSKSVPEAVQFVKFMTSKEYEKRNAIDQSLLPTMPDVYKDADVLKANPFYARLLPVFSGGAVARPSTITADRYNEVSTTYFQNVSKVLTGEQDGKTAAANIAKDIQRIMR